ncbi:hypothetical protein NPIL_578921 [Nephila pilipes]|uniref:Uncharacterized protein n=1 Tax=Nephila pilipes TaxID=299642 RepID=A0A8X6NL54_NEPPI|nr:hypothetical protein NPIL_578921 [Nephila pilipes]
MESRDSLVERQHVATIKPEKSEFDIEASSLMRSVNQEEESDFSRIERVIATELRENCQKFVVSDADSQPIKW